jgi:ZIP family zinc transporter
MDTWRTVLLGFIAGATIFLGLPVGRLRNPRLGLKAFLNAASAGILLFLLVEILHDAFEPVEGAVEHLAEGTVGLWPPVGLGLVFVTGLGAGLLSLLYLTRYQRRRRESPSIGPGAMAVAERLEGEPASRAMALGMSIAVGIGLHNFSEGLAIGQAARAGQLSLAVLLVVGFALHNATEGFGIVGPLAAGGVRASWRYLVVAGLVAGSPTFLGTIVGTQFQNEYLYVAFLALAGGAIVYVVAEMLNTGRRLSWELTMWGLLAGFVLGAATELVIAAASA